MDIYLDKYITDYNNCTNNINEAIKYINQNGGGRLIFSANKIYRSGMIFLLSNVELFLEKNSILMGSDNILDYSYLDNDMPKILDIPTYKDCSYNGKPTKYFIYAYKQNNIKICGEGIIDGNE